MNVINTYFMVKTLPGATNMGLAATTASEAAQQRSHRQQEYIECILRNTSRSVVEVAKVVRRAHLLVQDDGSMKHLRSVVLPQVEVKAALMPVRFSRAPEQPLYKDLFLHANRLCSGQLCMVCNADIYLRQDFPIDDVQRCLEADPNKVFALTRYENEAMFGPLIDDYRGSHDAFVFKAPLKQDFVDAVDHKQNCYQSENIVIHELKRAGYDVRNPCKSCHIFHRHEAEFRQWYPSVDEQRYAKAEPCTLEECFD